MNEIAIRDLAEVTELDEKVMSSTVGGSAGSVNHLNYPTMPMPPISAPPSLPNIKLPDVTVTLDNDFQNVIQTQVGFGGGSVQQAMSAYLSA
jgi:hypothetical protein